MKKAATKQEKEYMGKVASLPCHIFYHFFEYRHECSPMSEVHHTLGDRDPFKTMPLCFNHHSAQTPLAFGCAVHKGTKSFEARYTTQIKMVESTQQQINGE